MKRFGRLLLMEIENIWRFPTIELVIATAILNALRTPFPILPQNEQVAVTFFIANPALTMSTLFLSFIIPVLVARVFAKGLSGNETRVLLSYPVKRWEILLSKVTVVLLPTFAIFSIVFFFNTFYMYQLSVSNPLPYAFLVPQFFSVALMTALAFIISLFAKDELKAVLFSLFILLFLGFSSEQMGAPYRYISPAQGSTLIMRYLEFLYYGNLSNFLRSHPILELQLAFGFPIVTTIVLLSVVFLYFQHKLDID